MKIKKEVQAMKKAHHIGGGHRFRNFLLFRLWTP